MPEVVPEEQPEELHEIELKDSSPMQMDVLEVPRVELENASLIVSSKTDD